MVETDSVTKEGKVVTNNGENEELAIKRLRLFKELNKEITPLLDLSSENEANSKVCNKKSKTDKECTAEAIVALSHRYSPETFWRTFTEVHLEGRRADFIAMNILPSRSFAIVGFEIKASRQDWLKEVQDCGKAECLIRQCDEWYVLAAREGIIKPEEVPPTWGFMVLTGKRLKVIKPSNVGYKQNISREFVIRVIEDSYQRSEEKPLAGIIYAAEQRGYERGIQSGREDYKITELRKRVEIIDRLEKNDIKIKEWELGDIKLMRSALDLIDHLRGYHEPTNQIEHSINCLKTAAESLEKIGEQVKEVKKNLGDKP
jgi:hypothetical protein